MRKETTLLTLLYTLIILVTEASAQDKLAIEIIPFILIVITIAAILYTYRLTQAKNGLEARALELKKIIEKQRTEIQENESKLRRQKEELYASVDARTLEEARKAEGLLKSKKPTNDTLRREYWDRLGQLSSPSPRKAELEKLLSDKTSLESIIELTKIKHSTGILDNNAFSEIMAEYEKKLIELESKLNQLKDQK